MKKNIKLNFFILIWWFFFSIIILYFSKNLNYFQANVLWLSEWFSNELIYNISWKNIILQNKKICNLYIEISFEENKVFFDMKKNIIVDSWNDFITINMWKKSEMIFKFTWNNNLLVTNAYCLRNWKKFNKNIINLNKKIH